MLVCIFFCLRAIDNKGSPEYTQITLSGQRDIYLHIHTYVLQYMYIYTLLYIYVIINFYVD